MVDVGPPEMIRYAGLLAKIAITAGLLWLLFRNHRLTTAILPHLGLLGSNVGWTLAGIACALACFYFEALRWRVLLRGQGYEVTQWCVFRTTIIASFFNITSLGTAGGDTYRVLAMAKSTGSKKLPMITSVLLDHMLGSVGVALLFLVTNHLLRETIAASTPEVRTIVAGFKLFITGALGGILLSFLLCSSRLYGWAEARHPVIFGWAPMKRFVLASAAQSRNWGASARAIGCSILLYFAQYLTFYCGIQAVGGHAPLLAVVGTMPMVDAAAGLPISVSGLGVREKTFETLMTGLTGLPGATAVSASLAGWLMGIFWALLGGVLFIRGSRAPAAEAETEPA